MARRKKVPCKGGCPWPLAVRGRDRAVCTVCGSIFVDLKPVAPGAKLRKE